MPTSGRAPGAGPGKSRRPVQAGGPINTQGSTVRDIITGAGNCTVGVSGIICSAGELLNGGIIKVNFSRKDRAMADVIGFLEARIAEDESAARAMVLNVPGADYVTSSVSPLCPERVLAECAAKRKILGNVPLVNDISSQMGGTSGYVLMCLASVYSQHPDYQEGWRVDGLNEMPKAGSQRLSASGAQF